MPKIQESEKKKSDLECPNIRKFRNVPVDVERPSHPTYQPWERKGTSSKQKIWKSFL
jgi:hypothetical protein